MRKPPHTDRFYRDQSKRFYRKFMLARGGHRAEGEQLAAVNQPHDLRVNPHFAACVCQVVKWNLLKRVSMENRYDTKRD